MRGRWEFVFGTAERVEGCPTRAACTRRGVPRELAVFWDRGARVGMTSSLSGDQSIGHGMTCSTRWMRPPQTHLMSRPARPRIRNGPGRGSRAKIDPQTHPTRTSDQLMSWSRHRSTHSPHPMPRRGRGAQSCGDTVTLDVVPSGATGGHDLHQEGVGRARRLGESLRARGSEPIRTSAIAVAIAIAGIGVPALLVGGEVDAP